MRDLLCMKFIFVFVYTPYFNAALKDTLKGDTRAKDIEELGEFVGY